MPSKNAYEIEEFIECCSKHPEKVVVTEDALKDAQSIFRLYTKPELLNFIGNGGMEKLAFVNSKPLEKSPFPEAPFIDAYEFYTHSILGYIAFFKSPKNGKWVIKSFHQSENRSGIMEDAMLKFLNQRKEITDGK